MDGFFASPHCFVGIFLFFLANLLHIFPFAFSLSLSISIHISLIFALSLPHSLCPFLALFPSILPSIHPPSEYSIRYSTTAIIFAHHFSSDTYVILEVCVPSSNVFLVVLPQILSRSNRFKHLHGLFHKTNDQKKNQRHRRTIHSAACKEATNSRNTKSPLAKS